MAATRDLWGRSFPDDDIPAYPCPECDRGTLRYAPKSRREMTGDNWKQALQEGLIDPTDVVARFHLFLQCSIDKCGSVVSVHGDSQLTEREAWDHQQDRFFHVLTPHGMDPAPPLATVPESTPEPLKNEFATAFALFWIDLGACANRLRIIVEKILDHQGVTAGVLARRIEAYKGAQPGHADTFDALRFVGNIGSHEGEASREAVLDCFELLQDAIAELFGERTTKLAGMKKRIIAAKGRV